MLNGHHSVYYENPSGSLTLPQTFLTKSAKMMFSGQQTFLVFLLVIVRLCCLVAAAATCYTPDGTVAIDDTPCSGSLPSRCCPGGICLSNGLCFVPSNSMLARSSCTDKSWSSSVCTNFCRSSKTIFIHSLTPATYVCILM